MKMPKIYLASSSERRSELLNQIGLDHTVIKPHVHEEIMECEVAHEMVMRLAHVKALTAIKKIEDKTGIVIAADTVALFRGEIMGKPRSINGGAGMLSKLSGNTHEALTGFAIIDMESGKTIVDYESTTVEFRKLTEQEIKTYSKLNESRDAAGAYSISKGAAKFVRRLEGEYTNVAGLPLGRITEILNEEFLFK